MNDLVLTIRIVLVRAAFAFGRRLPLRSRVVLATAHAAAARRQPGGHRGRPGGAPSADPGRGPRPPAGRRRPRPDRRRLARGRRRLLPGDLAGVHRGRLLLPDLRDPPAAGHDDRPDVARVRGVQEGRLQRARQVVRGGRGARQPGPDPLELRRLPRRLADGRAALRGGVPPAARALPVRPGHPADGRALRRGAPGPDARRGPRAIRPDRRPPGDPVRADLPRRQRHRRARHGRPRPAASCATPSAPTTSCSSGCTRSSGPPRRSARTSRTSRSTSRITRTSTS